MKHIKHIKEYLTENTDNKIVYHGTDNRFTEFDDSNPLFFVDSREVAETYGRYVIEAELVTENPVELDFDGKSTYYLNDKWMRPSEVASYFKEIHDEMSNSYSIDDEVMEELEYLGFSALYGDLDGVVMENISDSMGTMFSDLAPATNYVVFDKNQVKIKNIL